MTPFHICSTSWTNNLNIEITLPWESGADSLHLDLGYCVKQKSPGTLIQKFLKTLTLCQKSHQSEQSD